MLESMRVLSVSGLAGRTGRGVRVAVIDSGIHAGHPHIGSLDSAVAFDDDGVEQDDVVDWVGHGTAVAAAVHEKAPEASLLSAKIFNRTLTTTGAALVAGVRWAVQARADIVNLSLGTANPDRRAGLEAAVGEALRAGIIVVAAAPDADHQWLPGAFSGVIGVELEWTCPRDECIVSRTDHGEIVVRASGFPRPIPGVPPERNVKGQSFAVANATGLIALAIEGSAPGSRAILPPLR